MRFEYAPYDGNYYVTGVTRDSNTKLLSWKHSAGIDSLVVQTPFGVSATDILESQLIAALNGAEFIVGTYTELLPGVFARIVSSAELSRGCTLNGEARTYTVFAMKREGDTYKVFEQRWKGMIRPWRDVPLELSVRIEKVMKEQGIFKKTQVPTGFYRITFGVFKEKFYRDGDIYYRVGNTEIPLTGVAIEQRDIYVKSNTRPEVFSRNEGIKLV